MSRAESDVLVIGGEPIADLLPPATREALRRQPIVRRLLIGLGLFTVIVLLITAGATFLSFTAAARLDAERQRSDVLLAQQLEFAEARSVNAAVEETRVARLIGTVTEADWNALLAEINGTLPTGVALTSVDGSITGAPAEDEEGEEIPLREVSVGSFRINATSPTVPDVEAWLEDLEGITGFAGIAPPVTVSGSESDGFIVTIEVLLNEGAYLLRFVETDDAQEED